MVQTVPYLELLSQLVEDMEDRAIELFIWWNVIYAVASHVNEEMKELKEAIDKQILMNLPSKSRNELCVETVSSLMKIAIGYQVKDYASEEQISEVKEMIHYVRSSFTNFIYALDWMDEETKFATVEKLYTMNLFVGYPNWFNDTEIMENVFANVTLKRETHLLNVLYLLGADIYNEFASLDYINDRFQMFFEPLDVNAFYDPSSNSIIVPYGIIQQPYYNMGLQALNYGAIGTILGHEMTHGLDNTGRMYDKFGSYRIWWSNFSSEEYSKRADCFLDAYNNFYLESINST
uniref:Peptidase M13 C-terminal domain-containing protein n=3 Tax=Rhodnius prolixus TaxID=13249 RepID=T1I2E8_RHOPR